MTLGVNFGSVIPNQYIIKNTVAFQKSDDVKNFKKYPIKLFCAMTKYKNIKSLPDGFYLIYEYFGNYIDTNWNSGKPDRF